MDPIIPMEPKLSQTIPRSSNWVAQVKWDGVRVLVYGQGKSVRLYNRQKRERTLQYPELIDLQSYLSVDSAILDGELIALGQDGKPDFHQIMRRDGIRRVERVLGLVSTIPVAYMVFDILFVNGRWITDWPFQDRMDLLARCLKPSSTIQLVSSHEDGDAVYRAIQEQGMEGIVVKRIDSPYTIDQKSGNWLKIKNYRDLVAVVGGFTLNGGIVNALFLGLYDQDRRLHFVGHSGTGKLTRKEWGHLTNLLKPWVIPTCPFMTHPPRSQGAVWVQPRWTTKIKYMEWQPGGSLRQASIQALVDVPPEICLFNPDMQR